MLRKCLKYLDCFVSVTFKLKLVRICIKRHRTGAIYYKISLKNIRLVAAVNLMKEVPGTLTRFLHLKPGFHSNAMANENRKKRKRLRFSRNKRKRQQIGMLGRSSGNHDWLLANASACVSCGFRVI